MTLNFITLDKPDADDSGAMSDEQLQEVAQALQGGDTDEDKAEQHRHQIERIKSEREIAKRERDQAKEELAQMQRSQLEGSGKYTDIIKQNDLEKAQLKAQLDEALAYKLRVEVALSEGMKAEVASLITGSDELVIRNNLQALKKVMPKQPELSEGGRGARQNGHGVRRPQTARRPVNRM